MWRHCVYLHRKASTGEPFYVGKGRSVERAHVTEKRNTAWQRTVAKHGLIVEVIASCIDDVAAQEIERALIKEIGRRDLGLGPLVNLTDGGDGHAGIVASEALRAKRRINSKGPRSDAWVASIRASRKGGGNGGVVKKGDKLPDWWKARIAATKQGADNPMFGRTGARHPNGKPVIDDATGATYPTVTAAARALGIRMQTLHNMLTGFRPNSTQMRLG